MKYFQQIFIELLLCAVYRGGYKRELKTQEKIHVEHKPSDYTRIFIVSNVLFIKKQKEEKKTEGERAEKSFKTRKENLMQCCNAKGVVEYVLQESKTERDFCGLDYWGKKEQVRLRLICEGQTRIKGSEQKEGYSGTWGKYKLKYGYEIKECMLQGGGFQMLESFRKLLGHGCEA